MEKRVKGKLVEILSSIQAANRQASDFTKWATARHCRRTMWRMGGFVLTFVCVGCHRCRCGELIAYNKGFNDCAATHRDGWQKAIGTTRASLSQSSARFAFVCILACVPVINEALLCLVCPRSGSKELAQLVK